MSNDLNINFDETISVGEQIKSKAGDIRDVLIKIKNANAQLESVWTGADASKYLSRVNEQSAYMDELATTIDDIGDFLIKAGEAYRNAGNENAQEIR